MYSEDNVGILYSAFLVLCLMLENVGLNPALCFDTQWGEQDPWDSLRMVSWKAP